MCFVQSVFGRKNAARPDARQVEEAFEAKLTAINGQSNGASLGDGHDMPQVKPTSGEVVPARSAATGQAAEAIDKSDLVHLEPRRIRDKDHLRFVATQPCLVCGRTPADPHHLRFAQSRALGRKVSDEWVVALCRGHHREVHRHGDERCWWEKAGIDPNVTARSLWLQSQSLRARHNYLVFLNICQQYSLVMQKEKICMTRKRAECSPAIQQA